MTLESSAVELAKIIRALDRCEHGRHMPDTCNGCGAQSLGNQFLLPGQRIGTSLYGQAIVVPHDWSLRGIASYWLEASERSRYGREVGPV